MGDGSSSRVLEHKYFPVAGFGAQAGLPRLCIMNGQRCILASTFGIFSFTVPTFVNIMLKGRYVIYAWHSATVSDARRRLVI